MWTCPPNRQKSWNSSTSFKKREDTPKVWMPWKLNPQLCGMLQDIADRICPKHPEISVTPGLENAQPYQHLKSNSCSLWKKSQLLYTWPPGKNTRVIVDQMLNCKETHKMVHCFVVLPTAWISIRIEQCSRLKEWKTAWAESLLHLIWLKY